MPRRHHIVVSLVAVLGACEPELAEPDDDLPSFGDAERLVFGEDFVDAPSDDPFAEHRPADVTCSPAAWRGEAGALELDSGLCNYFTLTAPALTTIEPGDRIAIRAFHDDLAANEPAVVHLALFVDGNGIWDQEVSIPSPPIPYSLDVIADFAAPAGSPVALHLHNHGVNNYRLVELTVAPRL